MKLGGTNSNWEELTFLGEEPVSFSGRNQEEPRGTRRNWEEPGGTYLVSPSVKGLQSCCLSNFEKDLIPDAVELGLTGSRVAGARWQIFS